MPANQADVAVPRELRIYCHLRYVQEDFWGYPLLKEAQGKGGVDVGVATHPGDRTSVRYIVSWKNMSARFCLGFNLINVGHAKLAIGKCGAKS